MFTPDSIKELLKLAEPKEPDKELLGQLALLTAEKAGRDELLREGFDLLNAVMLRSGLIFKLHEHGEIVAKVKAWNLRVQKAGIIKIVSGVAG